MRPPSGALLLVAARCLLEATLFAALAALLHRLDGSARHVPLPLIAVAIALWGTALVLTSVLLHRERSQRDATRLALAVAVAGAVGGALLDPDARGLAMLTRLVGFGVLAEAYLWRTLSIARDGARWHEARNAWLLTSLVLGFAALMPDPFDRAALAPLALASVIAGGAALALARATEELRDEGADVHGDLARGTTGGGTILLGALALVAALIEPAAQDALGPAVRGLDEVLARAVLVLLLPFALLAGWLTEALRGLLAGRLPVPLLDQGQLAGNRAEEAANLEALEAIRPFVFGLTELLLALVALAVGILLVERMVRERRALLPPGATLERSSVDGMDLGGMFGALRGPRYPPPWRPPLSDGSPGAVARLLYWHFQDLAERAGAGRRAPEETPFEHAERLAHADVAWESASPLVDAFAATRYAERDPTPALLEAARSALAGLERSIPLTRGPRGRAPR